MRAQQRLLELAALSGPVDALLVAATDQLLDCGFGRAFLYWPASRALARGEGAKSTIQYDPALEALPDLLRCSALENSTYFDGSSVALPIPFKGGSGALLVEGPDLDSEIVARTSELAKVVGLGLQVRSLTSAQVGLESLVANSAVGLARLSIDGQFLTANPKLCELLGYSAAELCQTTLEALSDGAWRRDSVEQNLECPLKQRSGGYLWVRVTLSRAEDGSRAATFEDVSARRQSEQRMATTEAQLSLFVDDAPAAVALLDRDMNYIRVSKRFAADYSAFPEVEARWRTVHARCLAGATERSEGESFTRADGRVDWVKWEMKPWRDGSGAIGGLVLFSELVTERRATARALVESEERFRAMFEQAGIGIALIDPATEHLVEVNDKACVIYGYSRAELIGRRWTDLTHPEDVTADRQAVSSLQHGRGESFTREKRFVRKSGEVIWGRVTVTRLKLEDVAPTLIVMLEDINHEKRAAEALRASERRLATVFERSLAGMVVVRASDGRIVEVSDSFSRMFGWSREELLGKTSADIGFWGTEGIRADVRRRMFEGEAALEVRARRKSGEEGDFLVTIGRFDLGAEPSFIGLMHDLTPLRRAHDALRASEQQLRAVFELVPVGIAELDLDSGAVLRVNPRLSAITGFTAEELAQRAVLEALPFAEDVPAILAALRDLERGSAELHVETRIRRKDGQTCWIHATLARAPKVDGEHNGALAAITDITQRRRDEANLVLYKSAFDAAANAITITDSKGRVERVNPAFSTLTLYSEAEIVGQPIQLVRSNAQPPEYYDELWRTVSSGRVWRGEVINRKKDGELYFEDMTITPLKNSEGQIEHFIAIKQDVTERRLVETSLRASEERYRVLVDNLEDTVLTTDSHGRVTFVNRAVEVFGRPPTELSDARLVELFHAADRRVLAELLAARTATAPTELRFADAQGRPRPVRVRVRPLTVNDAVAGATCVMTDLTMQRETEEQLRAAQKMEAVGRLAGGVAHDFNNLLTVILSYAEMILEDAPSEEVRADAEQVVGAARRAERLTRQLLAFSRRQVLEPEPLDLGELVRSIAKMLARLIGEDVDLQVEASGPMPRTNVDRGAMEQVIMNLAVNARDAMPDGGQITLGTRAVELDPVQAAALAIPVGRYVELTVRDTGCGMTREMQRHVFEPFFTTKERGRGTGLGLAIVFAIVQQSSGAIRLESEPNRGTTFHVYLPEFLGEAGDTGGHTPGARRRCEHECILVVEDDAALRELVERVLTREGYTVLVASGASEAFRVARDHGHRVHLILSDVIMPVMSGCELVERLRPLCPKARVMFMSGYTDETIERVGALVSELLRKPFDPPVLLERVRLVLDAEPVAHA